MKKDLFILNMDKTQCCGCAACANICPTGAIVMEADEAGFEYPRILQDKCVGCGACESVCGFRNSKIESKCIGAFAGASADPEVLHTSSSGGIFSEIADDVFADGGIVYGACMKETGNGVQLYHLGVSSKEELRALRGSKYFQSSIGSVFREIKEELNRGRRVLFCGTACQVDGLNRYLKKPYDTLLTVDIACHGVPGPQIYRDYISWLKKKYHAEDIQIRFRDKKKNGWQHGAVIRIIKKNGSVREKKISYQMSSFYIAFMRGQILRDSCYSCEYSYRHRPADITLGDYWGIQVEHPQLLKRNGGPLDEENGISCIMINTEKGREAFDRCKKRLTVIESSVEKIIRKNPALREPPKRPQDTEAYREAYRNEGFDGIERLYRQKYGKKYWIFAIKNMIPNSIKRKAVRSGR